MIKTYTYKNENTGSSAFEKIWYNKDTRELFVQFRDSGTIAGYADVSPIAADNFVGADSLGKHYAMRIKGNYKGIDTKDVKFSPANSADKPAVKQWLSDSPSNVITTITSKSNPVAEYDFVVTGSVTQNLERKIKASSMDEAVKKFMAEYPESNVKTVVLNFG